MVAAIKHEADVESENVQDSKRVKLEDSDSELDLKILAQIEYYFSDLNVIKDKFLQEEFKKNDGWVKLETLLRFARLKQLTSDEDRLVNALSEKKSDIIELDLKNKQVKRTKPVPDADQLQKDLDLRTVHISGFPTEYEFDTLQKFCTQYGEVESVSMRRYFKTRCFKGCIHVVFKKQEDAQKVLDTEVLKCKDRELKKESMDAYHKRKKEIAAKWAEKRKQRAKGDSNNEKETSSVKTDVQ